MTRIDTLVRQYWPTAALFIVLVILWQLAVDLGGIRAYLLPPPLAVWQSLWQGEVARWPRKAAGRTERA